jgi:2-dehydro-3-deoxyphosphogluconate aldolase/(4S)-4-hydroxy-2-oxoglutarate aldolase
MRSKKEICSALCDPGIIAVVRGRSELPVVPLSEALLAGGVNVVEITMTTPNAIEAIRAAKAAVGGRAVIGVGTVLDAGACKRAIDAGAEFVVTPILRTELIPIAHAAGRAIMVGAYTPSEAQIAHEAGADFVKIFPAETLGPVFIKSVLAPLPHLRIIPTGGLEVHNVAAFLKAGCVALGAGGSLVSSAILEKSDWPALTAKAKEFVQAAKSARAS